MSDANNHPKYEISQFWDLEQRKGFGEDLEVRFAARIAAMYYIYARHEMFSFCEINNELFEGQREGRIKDDEIPIYISRAWAAAFGMYALLRTVLEATKKIREAHPTIDWSDNVYQESIGVLIRFTNDAVKHPMFNGKGSKAYMAEQGISIDGSIELLEFSGVDTPAVVKTVEPEKDLTTVRNYIAYLATKVGTSGTLHQVESSS